MNNVTLSLFGETRLFSPSRLVSAREFRGLTQKALAESLDLTSMAISGYEKGAWQPNERSIKDIAQALDFPIEWFFRDEIFQVSDEALSYRSFARMTSNLKSRSRQTWNIAADLRTIIGESFNLPTVLLPDLSDETPEQAANTLRKMWGLGDEPISNVVHLLESKGVAVFWTDVDSRSVDAYCNWHDEWPLVILKSLESAGERGRFNAAHELAHLVLHREINIKFSGERNEDINPAFSTLPRQKMEKEAHKFAAAFLLPENAWMNEAPLSTNLDVYLKMKEYWGVSVQVMLRRSYDLELLSERQYELAMTEVSRRHWRLAEPEPVEVEHSLLHQYLFNMMAEDGEQTKDLADKVGLNVEDLEILMPVAKYYRASGTTYIKKPTLKFIADEQEVKVGACG